MTYTNFEEFFKAATAHDPYPYQKKLAEQKDIPEIINIPTGAGKTEAAILAIYLWRRKYSLDQETNKKTPRKLVYCLPMRVLVEQTVRRVEKCIKNLKIEKEVTVSTIMGGKTDRDYKLYPEKDMIIIGTQDMLLSRALNRGYGVSMFQWPIEFGLLNNDCLWIMDEVQLMHNGLATSVQLEAFRDMLKTYAPHKTVWMSATMNPQWLDTINFNPKKCTQFGITKDDLMDQNLSVRINAQKKLLEFKINSNKDKYVKKDAELILTKHVNGTTTLIIVNTVKRAQNLFDELKNIVKDDHDMLLIHSRFRAAERKKINDKIINMSEKQNDRQDVIIVSTQVVEAGIDISAKTMITEMAPWPSMIQRFGRCNRKGKDKDAKIYVIKLSEKQYSPYEVEDMKRSEENIDERINKSVSLKDLPEIKERITHDIVIRRSDIIGLFDTVSDINGNHTDVSRYVRSLEDTKDVSVYWKSWDGYEPEEKYKPDVEELCNVSISDIKEFIKDESRKLWRYGHLDGGWEREFNPHPGQTLLLQNISGGYTKEKGWNVKSKDSVDLIQYTEHLTQSTTEKSQEESHNSDTQSESNGWITLNDHTVHVENETKDILKELDHLTKLNKDIIITTAKYHDIGKAHDVFQDTMLKGTNKNEISPQELWAKRKGNARHERPNFRHEAASALAFLKLHPKHPNVNLIAYLIASHHGKVRLAMRSPPHKKNKRHVNPNNEYLLGLSTKNEESFDVFLSNKANKSKKSKEGSIAIEDIEKEVKINMDVAKIGSVDDKISWLQITLGLLKEYGPFRLAYLEAIIRAADSRASAKERNS